jgi:hypothetical protein
MRTAEAGRRSRIVKALGGAALAAALSASMLGQAEAAAAPLARAAAVEAAPAIGGGGLKPQTFWLWGWNNCGGYHHWGLISWVFDIWGHKTSKCDTPTPTTAGLGSYTITRNGSSIVVNGGATLPGTKVTLKGPDGGIICSTLASAAAVSGAAFPYPFTCTGTVSYGPGTYGLTLTGEKPGSTTQHYPITIVIEAPASVSVSNVAPNPTSGPVTISGTSNRPGTGVTVTNGDGSTLCTTTTNSSGGWSCSGTVPGADGAKTLTVKVGSATTTTTVTKTTAQSALAISGASASPNPTTGPVTVSGKTNRSGSKIEVKNADGTVLCTTTGATSAVSGLYAFSCSGTVTGADGAKSLTIKATGPNGNTVSTTVPVTKAAGNNGGSLAISGTTASPNPTTGPVTIAGKTNRAGAKIEVKNADGTLLCSTTGSSTAVNGLYSFSCSGTVTGATGSKSLTVKATGPNGNVVTVQVPVTLTSGT